MFEPWRVFDFIFKLRKKNMARPYRISNIVYFNNGMFIHAALAKATSVVASTSLLSIVNVFIYSKNEKFFSTRL